ncbi:MAG: magnesium chelatase [Betaproteobacteria bacterium RIFCSPLOWO2_12_FULL_67_28]|nr:MAG: magnesium chelatase [Betaproteobacteria bacterium RIFCSPLOWO2_12_FULL_67_28]
METSAARALFERIAANIERVMRGQHDAVRKLLAVFASGGHVLIDDYPGTGKTTLAKSLAASIGAQFARVQFTPDLLPSDILGVSVFNQREQVFEFRQGPVFTSILLADEINRASPRTQSALLEVMAEGQVSVEGRTHPMDELFFVVATQNPVEFRGTYPLPESQMDRFALCLALGYVDAGTEVDVLAAQDLGHPLARLAAVVTREEVIALKARVRRVRMADELRHYVVELVRRTRSAPQVQLGCGPRASIALANAAKALALFDGEEFVRPDQVHELAVPVLAHRMVLDPQAKFAGASARALVADILREVKVPS